MFFLSLQDCLSASPATCICSAGTRSSALQEEILQSTADLERAQAAEQQLEAVLEQSADAVFITERDTEKILHGQPRPA